MARPAHRHPVQSEPDMATIERPITELGPDASVALRDPLLSDRRNAPASQPRDHCSRPPAIRREVRACAEVLLDVGRVRPDAALHGWYDVKLPVRSAEGAREVRKGGARVQRCLLRSRSCRGLPVCLKDHLQLGVATDTICAEATRQTVGLAHQSGSQPFVVRACRPGETLLAAGSDRFLRNSSRR